MFKKLIQVLVLASAGWSAAVVAAPPQGAPVARGLSSREAIQDWKKQHGNWGRWGQEDQLGTANLITPAKRKEAAKLVRDGVSVSLAHTLETRQAADVPSPLERQMLFHGEAPESTYSADHLGIGFHGWSHTHLDALCHVFDEGRTYNGYPQSKVDSKGCSVLSVNEVRDGLLTRGVLIDMAAFKGVPYLEPGTPIHAADLEAWERKTKVKVSSGDAIIVRTGRWARRAAVGPWDVSSKSPGLHASSVEWLAARGVSIVATDVGLDVLPSGVEGVVMPVHVLLINTLGVHVIDNADPEALAKAAAARGRYDFLLSVAPLAIEGGTGSPVNPIATF
ncbi:MULTISPECIES: cyclase family protein [Myxococcus]|uniref:Cyclase family protein n=1 Tax=Myxococcus llanfairpwllgwyngyllgogerychwyrndrobwllllantysiliogogogochensis TaxID=2590453 RepID=A0A540WR14_9BACT|nr:MULTISPECIES: cyclase family protein [Myxococcus]NTX03541.1 cyclase family protein [Myxococcus sp. CA040A]TQF11466.1 cyclase family protein [Myxococcus llanfairpwllgwyngyllgogerychwyrndrobwllllantysiliogogogochensis]